MSGEASSSKGAGVEGCGGASQALCGRAMVAASGPPGLRASGKMRVPLPRGSGSREGRGAAVGGSGSREGRGSGALAGSGRRGGSGSGLVGASGWRWVGSGRMPRRGIADVSCDMFSKTCR